ncbi:MAG: hypothetical protein FWH57_02100 [Oscillospiraceae bacterium]|nr:hypothetical protein [Oscillospiraceae bacterium]
MGIIIVAELLPQDVTPKQWEQAYEEALRLVDAYDFLDIIYDKEKYAKYNLTWAYAEKSKERDINGDTGVGIYGTYSGCISAERQYLYRDLNCYFKIDWHTRKTIQPDSNVLRCHDALIGRLYDIKELEKYHDYNDTALGCKTQGYPHHLYLLGIGLLLEDRLGKAFTIHGDITRGQIIAAIKWVNTVLDKPISIPCVMDNAKLIKRLQAFVPRENLLESFMDLTFNVHDEAMYQFLQWHFSEEEFAEYWKKRISFYNPNTIGSSDLFREYFNMTDNLKLLTKVCADKLSPEEFAKALALSRVFELEKNIDNPVATLSHDSDIETPETIETSMGKTFALLGGVIPHNSAAKRFIPLERGIRDITLAYRDIGDATHDVNALLRKAIKEAAPKNTSISEELDIFDELTKQIEKRNEQWDIYDPEDLVFYEAGDVLAPGIELNLKGIRKFVDTNKEGVAQKYQQAFVIEESIDKKFTRMAAIVRRCQRLLPKYIWDMFEQKIEDDVFFATLLGLNALMADTVPLSHYVQGLLYNPILFKQVLLS